MRKLYGIVCANITPMDAKGEPDMDSLKNLVNHMANTGIHGVYPTGTNGEGHLLDQKEQHAIAKEVIETNAGRMSAYIQCGSMKWKETMENIRAACENGADGVGVMTPTFYKADEATLLDYYGEAAEAAGGKPVYIYNIAKYTNNDVSVKVLGELIDRYPNIVGIKYSNDDIKRLQEYIRAPKSKRAEALIGSDSLILSVLAVGAAGGVSGPACVFPKRYVGLYEAFAKGDLETAREYQNRIVECSGQIRSVPQIPAIKAMLKMQGVIKEDVCRRPFRKLTAEEYKILEKALRVYENEI